MQHDDQAGLHCQRTVSFESQEKRHILQMLQLDLYVRIGLKLQDQFRQGLFLIIYHSMLQHP